MLGIPVTSVGRTQFDLAGMLSKRGLERAMHEAEVRQLRDRLSLWDLLARYPRRRGAANLRALLAAKTPAGITQTELEELFVEFLDEYGLPRPHRTDRAFEGDRQRDRILLVEGWRSMRITWRQLRDERAAIAADLWDLLRVEPRPPTL
ncbi:MAG: hypothetical protein JWM24_581 [Solirubrobacterales bacterium]|nr:hypothetical protein [Solirubrobacterales bacterium]